MFLHVRIRQERQDEGGTEHVEQFEAMMRRMAFVRPKERRDVGRGKTMSKRMIKKSIFVRHAAEH